ncbi:MULTISPECIES: AraC family transcriptional regulator [unclassified Pseudomonas]|uniref:AraC family transcriptional regulator n=1 Tax=unclassified Pseudomonas TaxID=196821 RepID=UPI001C4991F9|nr:MULTISPECIES: AraC family transcriptional regulator [unclassified Pseudomonas]
MIFELNADDEARRAETATIREHLAKRIEEYLGDDTERMTSLPGLSFAKVKKPTPPGSYLYEPCISMIIRGRKRVRLGTTTYIYNESRFLLTAVNLPTVTEVLDASPDAPYVSLLMRLDLQTARQVMADVDSNGIASGPVTGVAMATGPATLELFDAVDRLISLTDKPQDLAHVGPLIQREIIYRILVSSAGLRFRETIIAGTQSQRTAKAIVWLRDNYMHPFRIEDLAAIANMGVSTLHHHFRAMTSMSPLQYQKHLRLHEARRILLTEAVDAATAAIRVGYESATQFNREYKRSFGAPPMRDISQCLAIGEKTN